MPLKIVQMKSITHKVVLTFFLLFFALTFVDAQEIIKDSVVTAPKVTVPSGKRLKVDGVVATVGDERCCR